jgi:prepilin-type processing-associated H-X9-DG protein
MNGYRLQTLANPCYAGICSDLQGGGCGGYHRNTSNVAMLDGHVENIQDFSTSMIPQVGYPQVLTWGPPNGNPGYGAYGVFMNNRPDGKIYGFDY